MSARRPQLRTPAQLERYTARVASMRWHVVRVADDVLLSGHATEDAAREKAARANEKRPGLVRVVKRGAR